MGKFYEKFESTINLKDQTKSNHLLALESLRESVDREMKTHFERSEMWHQFHCDILEKLA